MKKFAALLSIAAVFIVGNAVGQDYTLIPINSAETILDTKPKDQAMSLATIERLVKIENTIVDYNYEDTTYSYEYSDFNYYGLNSDICGKYTFWDSMFRYKQDTVYSLGFQKVNSKGKIAWEETFIKSYADGSRNSKKYWFHPGDSVVSLRKTSANYTLLDTILNSTHYDISGFVTVDTYMQWTPSFSGIYDYRKISNYANPGSHWTMLEEWYKSNGNFPTEQINFRKLLIRNYESASSDKVLSDTLKTFYMTMSDVDSANSKHYRTYEYNALNQIEKRNVFDSIGNPLSKTEYTYDSYGNINFEKNYNYHEGVWLPTSSTTTIYNSENKVVQINGIYYSIFAPDSIVAFENSIKYFTYTSFGNIKTKKSIYQSLTSTSEGHTVTPFTMDSQTYHYELFEEPVSIVGNDKIMLNLFPNPASNILFVELPNEKAINYELKVYDITGKMVLQSPILSNTNQVQISDLYAGQYFTLLVDKQGKVWHIDKFIKN